MVIIGHENVLETVNVPSGWASEDPNRALLRIVLRVRDLNAAIKFYSEHFNMRVQTFLDVPGAAVQRALLSVPPLDGSEIKAQYSGGAAGGRFSPGFSLELLEDSTASEDPRTGDWLSHFTLIVPSTADCLQSLRNAGRDDLILDPLAAVIPVRSTSPLGGQSTQDTISVVSDLDGYRWRIMEMRGAPPGAQRLCTIALRVSNIETSLAWYADNLGTKTQQEYVASQPPEYKTALVGFGPELQATQIELRQTKEPPAVDRGSGFVRLVVNTSSLGETRKSLERSGVGCDVVDLESVMNAVGPPETAIKCQDPDGWEVCFVQVE